MCQTSNCQCKAEQTFHFPFDFIRMCQTKWTQTATLSLSHTHDDTHRCVYSTSFDRFIDAHFFWPLASMTHFEQNREENRVRCTFIDAILDCFETNERRNECMGMLLNIDSNSNEYTSFPMHNEWMAMRQSTQKAFVSALYSIETFTVIIHTSIYCVNGVDEPFDVTYRSSQYLFTVQREWARSRARTSRTLLKSKEI